MKANQIDFLEQMLSDNDNVSCEPFPITMTCDYSLDFLSTLERKILETVLLPYGFSVAVATFPTRIRKTT